MIRFRFTEDEQRYLNLRSAIYRLLATLSPKQTSTALGALSKLETLLLLEGIRQGIAVAALSELTADERIRHLKAFQAHAEVYGSSDTPLRSVELEHLKKAGLPENHDSHAWLDNAPMRFAPTAETEDIAQPHTFNGTEPQEPADSQCRSMSAEEVAALLAAHDKRQTDDDMGDSPMFLDAVRDRIQAMLSGGWKPTNWGDLILKLHVEMQTDAAFLDLQLSTEMGRTILDQCGLLHIQAGNGLDLHSLLNDAAISKPTEP